MDPPTPRLRTKWPIYPLFKSHWHIFGTQSVIDLLQQNWNWVWCDLSYEEGVLHVCAGKQWGSSILRKGKMKKLGPKKENKVLFDFMSGSVEKKTPFSVCLAASKQKGSLPIICIFRFCLMNCHHISFSVIFNCLCTCAAVVPFCFLSLLTGGLWVYEKFL